MPASVSYYYLLVSAFSISSGLVGCLILTSAKFTRLAQSISNIQLIAAFCLFMSALMSCALCLSVYDPMLYMRLSGISLLIYMLMYISFYHVFFLYTRIDPSDQFSRWNYIIPILLCMTIQSLDMMIPGNVLVDLFEHHKEPSIIAIYWHHYPLFIGLFMMKPIIIYVIDIYYALMAIMRLNKIYKLLQERDEVTRKNKIWYRIMMAVIVSSAVAFLTVSRHVIAQFDVVTLLIIITINNIIDATFVHYLLSDSYKSYIIIDGSGAMMGLGSKATHFTLRRFENYMSRNKSRYMDKRSHLSDIYNDLNITADEFTQFIKEQYNQKPGEWLKRWRRIQEIKQLVNKNKK